MKNVPPRLGASAPLLLTDGSVLIHDTDATDWWKLTPDAKGNYTTGTWTQVRSTPYTYGPQYYASAVLPDGKVVVIGGEYNVSNSEVWTNLGYIYDPVANTWTYLPAPYGWEHIGDAQSVVLPDGTFMLANFETEAAAILDESTLAWTEVSVEGKADRNDEEGWTLLPDGSVFTVNDIAAPGAQRYLPSMGEWISAGTVPVQLPARPSQELGPQVLQYNGKVLCIGGTSATAIYTPPTTLTGMGSWEKGPAFPNVSGTNTPFDVADGPACPLPNGDILIFASPGVYQTPSQFFLYNGSTLTAAPGTPDIATDSSYYGMMLLLPTGQVMFTDFSSDIEVYTPAGAPQNSWRPAITSVPSTVTEGETYKISGTQFNGLTQGAAYGDDYQSATNYPLVRITNSVTGNVFYCRTSGHSTMAIATGSKIVSTNFEVPATIDSGVSTVQVIANGIASNPVQIHVNGLKQYSLKSMAFANATVIGGAQGLGTVYFSDTAEDPATIALSSSNQEVATVPEDVALAAGATSRSFAVSTTTVKVATVITIHASCLGVTVSNSFTVEPVGVIALSLNYKSVTGGTTVTGTVVFSSALPADENVELKSSDASVASVANTVVAGEGKKVAYFTVSTRTVSEKTTVAITATFNGSATAALVLVP